MGESTMKKTINRILIFFPFILICLVSFLKWKFFDQSVFIFIFASIVCLLLGLFLVIYSRWKYRAKIRSLGATMISLLTMQKVAGFSLVIVAILAFTWLIDYIREIPVLGRSPQELLAGAIFSISLMFIVVGIVVFIEKQKLDQFRAPHQDIPLRTAGLILSLSVFGKSNLIDELQHNLNLIQQYNRAIREIFKMILNCKTAAEIENIEESLKSKNYADDAIKMYRLIAATPIYPPLLAIQHHSEKLKHAWMLVTPEARKTSAKIFKTLARALYKRIKLKQKEIDDPDNVNAICKKVDEIYMEAQDLYGLGEADVTADITSGPASATAGMILACVRSKRQVEYLGRRSMNLQAIEVNVRSIPHLFDELIEQIELIRRT